MILMRSSPDLHKRTSILDHGQSSQIGRSQAGAPSQRRAAAPVEVIQVHPDALALAVELAKGDIRRIQVVDARTVLVRNKTRGR
jgi:hypothetical protein